MRTNPMARRLAMLSDQWASFLERRGARLLCWQLTAAERDVFDAFIELESDERTAEHATLFVTLDQAFDGPEHHGRSLSEALAYGITASEDELEANGLPRGWKLPSPRSEERDPAYLVRSAESMLSFFEVRGELALILRPRAASDAPSYARWLGALAAEAPERLRIVVLDDAGAPAFTQLSVAAPERIVCACANLDVPGALLELSDAAGNLDTPGGKFRDLFVRMGNALEAGDLEHALALGDAAVQLSKTQTLWQLSVPVHVALAATLLVRGREEDALARYAQAEAEAKLGSEQEDATLAGLCGKLYLQARLAHGGGLAGLHRWGRAAAQFEQTVPMAAAVGDGTVVLDCHRLASFCYEQAGDADRAWHTALLGLEQARALEPNAREYGNFASLAQALRRMAAERPAQTARPVLAQLARLREPPEPRADHASVSI